MSYKIEMKDQIMTFTIDRPEIRNAINDEVMVGLEELIKKVHNSNPRVVIITATGSRAFCSGGDLSVFHELKTEEQAYPMLKRMSEVLYSIKTLPVPVVALVNGAAVGGGCEIATACDYRLVWEHAKCGFIQGTLAMTSGWGGATYLFETLQHDRALKMLSDANALSAEQLFEMGWATKVVKDQADIDEFFQTMKKIRPEVHRAYKEVAIRKWRLNGLKDRVEAEVRRCAELWAKDAHHEAVNDFLTKPKK
ncbi:enoyl-CoA hydratase/isomerase family protein [Planococcus shenhongbingii]|uniref:Ethylmalonyl-CoA decarboxylase n=1 Tax=Planococcus shenhongbingii TaxID=3058398 RepID=A0ABT8N960_9BACL|nr:MULTISPECIES: enoyl-CoA hydratase/isomerase family protein [unclassified Planococcus (in: firmicutes)]MDN7244283.1 enoyl-CoA hydratase/isomerase family protein [Planococcus sp. N017]WKA57452.1 enoyl-CoA hydratase/isomerase family protein [Planococcus sp. N016]